MTTSFALPGAARGRRLAHAQPDLHRQPALTMTSVIAAGAPAANRNAGRLTWSALAGILSRVPDAAAEFSSSAVLPTCVRRAARPASAAMALSC